MSWKHISEQTIYKNKQNLCSKCMYSSLITDSTNVSALTCDYILIEEHSRGCSPINCQKFVPADKERKKKNLRLRARGK